MHLRKARVGRDTNEGEGASVLMQLSENTRPGGKEGSQPHTGEGRAELRPRESVAPAKTKTVKVTNDLIRP